MTPAQASKQAIQDAVSRAQGTLPPPFLVRFLLDHWRRYLAITYRDQGESSRAWQEAVKITDQLLWSIGPKDTREDKQLLTEQLELLVSSVRLGMGIAGADAKTQDAFLKDLSNLHIELISKPAKAAGTGFSPQDTLQLNVNDPRHRELMDMLQNAELEKIEI